ncbi:glutathione S-transferase family protein [Comamonas sp. GB3 AK4-5]|uniref:glutathione S-transferase family protein n=1 Tax=Comamonas sp. GB3 AK4-5 TaxID=3231487 RepID=UPI00351E26C0
MRLFLNATSPFARLARVIALEKGLDVELVWCDPWANDAALLAVHPQGRIPVLVTADGHALSESLLIAQYLDAQGRGAPLLPGTTMAATLAQVGVGYGLMEAAFNTMIARKHDAAADHTIMGQRRLAAMQRDLAQLEKTLPAPLGASCTLDQLVVAVAAEYVNFRLPGTITPAQHPLLCQWLQGMARHPHLAATAFA